MRHLVFFCFLFFSLLQKVEAQTPTFADPPGPEHVLVVYNGNSTLSDSVMQYYRDARQIPGSNVLGLDSLINTDIYDPVSNTTHRIILDQQGEIIRDSINQNSSTPTIHAWLYFNERIAKPIANHLQNTYVNGTPLKDIIRYIVLCKGVPFRIDARMEDADSRGTNVICANLLTHLGETIDDEDALLDYYNNPPGLSNPYYHADQNFTMDHHFIPNHYKTNANVGGQLREVFLSYLVTHLSAPRFEDIQGMIDRSVNAINETDYEWFIDADPTPCAGWNPIGNTGTILNSLDITNYFFDNTEDVYYSYGEDIMSYSSNGIWTTEGDPNPCYAWMVFQPEYIQSQLTLTYADGAFFSTLESHNGLSIGTYPVIRTRGQGLIADFTLKGGTIAVGQAFHSPFSYVIENNTFFPSYAVGYTFIEAAYLGLFRLDGTNVVVGDPLTKIYDCVETIISSNTTIGSGNYSCDLIVEENATLTIAAGSSINLTRNTELNVYGSLVIESGANLNFDGYSTLKINNSGNLILNSGINVVFNNNSKFLLEQDLELTSGQTFIFNNSSEFETKETLRINPGTIMTFNNDSKFKINGSLLSLGNPSDKVIFNFSNSNQTQFLFQSGNRLEIDNTIINSCGIVISPNPNLSPPEYISITNSVFNNPTVFFGIMLNLNDLNIQTTPLISNCSFNNCTKGAISLGLVQEVNIENNSAELSSTATGILLSNVGEVNISDFTFIGGAKGISTPLIHPGEESLLFGNLNITQCIFESQNSAIELNGQTTAFESIEINGNHFEDCQTGIYLNSFYNSTIPVISNNILSGYLNGDSDIGILLTNGTEVLVSNNSITNFQTGINLSVINQPYILDNYITANDLSMVLGPGIFSLSSNGSIRRNTISGHAVGIELGQSSPEFAENYITENKSFGLLSSDFSVPNLSLTSFDGEGYPLTGYNSIFENGICDYEANSEIYIKEAYIELSLGCNTIADDRVDQTQQCDFTLLIDGVELQDVIYAEENYWGNHPHYGNDPTGRFGEEIEIVYDHYHSEPCAYNESEGFFVMTSNGTVIDTVYSTGVVDTLSQIEMDYSSADKDYYTNNFSLAKQGYNQILNNYGTDRKSLKAYTRLFQIEKNLNSSTQSFNSLRNFYSSKLTNITDSIMIGVIEHLMNLCLVAEKEFIPAINNFEDLVENNPNTTLAFYSELNALTTSLLLDSTTTLGKVSAKYLAKGVDDYNDKVKNLFNKRRGINIENSEIEIPTEYSLYQNYPNPFNPTTVLRYDIPKEGLINITVYNILGEKVKTLLNEIKNPGRYEVTFNAANLPSGVYLYAISAKDFYNAKKMLLLR